MQNRISEYSRCCVDGCFKGCHHKKLFTVDKLWTTRRGGRIGEGISSFSPNDCFTCNYYVRHLRMKEEEELVSFVREVRPPFGSALFDQQSTAFVCTGRYYTFLSRINLIRPLRHYSLSFSLCLSFVSYVLFIYTC